MMAHTAAHREVVLVTGAGKRIGRALALALAQKGHALAVHYHHSASSAEELVATIAAAGGRAVALQADLGQWEQTQQLVERAAQALGPVTVLINNASVFTYDTVDTVCAAVWQEQLDVNLRAPVVLAQRFAAQLPSEHEGQIINMIDQRVWRLTPHFISYTLSKAALWTATQTLAMALAPRIRVNAIAPGPVLPSTHQTAEQFAKQCRSTLLKRGAAPEDIVAGVLFLLQTRAITGQMIALDGGQHLPWPPVSATEAAD